MGDTGALTAMTQMTNGKGQAGLLAYCSCSSLVSTSLLWVLTYANSEHPEAMQTGSSGCQYNWLTIVLLLGLVLCYSRQCNTSVLPASLPSSTSSTGSQMAASESDTTTTAATRKRCPAVRSCRQACSGQVLAKRSCHR